MVSIDLEKSLNIIENGLESSLVSENINQIVNSFLMMTEFCDGKVFEKNFLYDSPDPKELRKFGKILDGLFSWI